MLTKLRDKFKKATIGAGMLAILPFSGFKIISDASAWDVENNFRQGAAEICSPRLNTSSSLNGNIEKQIIVDDALFELKKSNLASLYIQQQGGGACISSYDIPLNLDRFGYPVVNEQSSNRAKGEVIFSIADNLVNNYLEARGFPDRGRHGGVKGEFRTAVRMAMVAQILTEIELAGNNLGMQAALRTDFAPLFRNFKRHDILDIQNGIAAISAIKIYFKITKDEYNRHRNYSYNTQDMYEMGRLPDSSNIFDEFFRDGQNFSLRYFTNKSTTSDIYRKNRHNPHYRR